MKNREIKKMLSELTPADKYAFKRYLQFLCSSEQDTKENHQPAFEAQVIILCKA